MTIFHEYFYPIFGTGLAIACIASVIAGFSRGIAISIITMIIGILAFWAGLFLGSEIGYQKWQSMPNPPDEAFADTMPMGALIAGWAPAAVFCGIVFGVSRLLALGFRRKHWNSPLAELEETSRSNPSQETGNPYQSPPTGNGT